MPTTIDKRKFLKVFADCIPVKGHKRSCIYDLTRRKYYFIPNSLADILLEYDGIQIAKLFMDFDDNSILDDYLKFLLEKEIVFEADESEVQNFPHIDLEWKHPSMIISGIVDIDNQSQFNTNSFKVSIENLGLKHLQIRVLDNLSTNFLETLISSLVDTRLRSIELLLPYTEDHLNVASKHKLINAKILLIYFYEAPLVKTLFKEGLPKLILTPDKRKTLTTEKSPIPKYFAVNVQLFLEARNYNTFYNRKIFLDKNGHLRNTLFSEKSFGHIDEIDLAHETSTLEFQEFWSIKKDELKICRDCEFRYMCVDQRVPTKIEGEWGHTVGCRYNPYLAKWEWEDGYVTANQTLTKEHETEI